MKEIKVFIFTCSKCKKTNRRSVDKDKADEGICRTCRNIKADPNQLSIMNFTQ